MTISTQSPSYVLGQPDFTSNTPAATQNGMNNPVGVAYDSTNSRLCVLDRMNNRVLGISYDPIYNRLFVADTNNSRVMVFDASTSTIANGETAENVLGQSDFVSSNTATTQSGFSRSSSRLR
jgi:DNA-binding beta-propeller fold protein YncE